MAMSNALCTGRRVLLGWNGAVFMNALNGRHLNLNVNNASHSPVPIPRHLGPSHTWDNFLSNQSRKTTMKITNVI